MGILGIFNSNNMIINVSNIICFITIQTLFFYFIASKQFNKVLIDKTDIVSSYISHDPELRNSAVQYFQSDDWKALVKQGNQQTSQRDLANLKLIGKRIAPLIAGALVVLFGFIFKLNYYPAGTKWTRTDTILLSLVMGAFTTEFLFFIGIVSQYQHYGDHAIYNTLLQSIKQKLLK